MRRILLSALMLMAGVTASLACELCKKNQPKVLENITHGSGPTGTLDYVITWSAAILVIITLVLSLKFLIRPGEHQTDHIKNVVLNQH